MRLLSFLATTVLLTCVVTVRGDVVITIDQNRKFVAGNSPATLDVFIQGGPISSFSIRYLLSDGLTHLEFLSQLDPGQGPTLDATNYVFAGNSGDVSALDPAFASGFGAASAGPGGVQTVFSGSDFTEDFTDVTIAASNSLLTRLQFHLPVLVASPSGRDEFLLTIDIASSGFFNANGNIVPINLSDSRLSAIVAVEAAAVPEPCTFCLSGLGTLLAGMVWRRRLARRT